MATRASEFPSPCRGYDKAPPCWTWPGLVPGLFSHTPPCEAKRTITVIGVHLHLEPARNVLPCRRLAMA